MSSSNNNNSANEQITEGLDIESEADASTVIPAQHTQKGNYIFTSFYYMQMISNNK